MNSSFNASEHSTNQIISAEILGSLILEELKGIRKDIKEEVKNLGHKLQEILFSYLSGHDSLQFSDTVKAGKINIVNVNDLNTKDENYPCFEDENGTTYKEPVSNYDDVAHGSNDQVFKNSSSFLVNDIESNAMPETSRVKEELPISGFKIKEPRSSSLSEDESDLFEQADDKICDSLISRDEHLLNSVGTMEDSNIVSNSSTSAFSLSGYSQEKDRNAASKTDNDKLISDSSYENLIRNNLLPLYASLSAQQNYKNLLPLNPALPISTSRQSSSTSKVSSNPKISASSLFNKRYRCQICGKVFAQKKYAEMHFLTHNGEKPFKCTVCEVGFLTNGNLKRHMIVHTGEKPFTCSYCGKSFSFAANMKRHIQIHLRLPRTDNSETGVTTQYVDIRKKS